MPARADLSPRSPHITNRNAYDALSSSRSLSAGAKHDSLLIWPAPPRTRAIRLLVFHTPDATLQPHPLLVSFSPIIVIVPFTVVAARLLPFTHCILAVSRPRSTTFLYLSSHPETPLPRRRSCPKDCAAAEQDPVTQPAARLGCRRSRPLQLLLPTNPPTTTLYPPLHHHHRLPTHAARSRTPLCLDAGCYHHRCRSYRLYPSAAAYRADIDTPSQRRATPADLL